jgi:NAD(P)-dependent dehydrogenase (short-subunit alcohol dehydrogenase family)
LRGATPLLPLTDDADREHQTLPAESPIPIDDGAVLIYQESCMTILRFSGVRTAGPESPRDQLPVAVPIALPIPPRRADGPDTHNRLDGRPRAHGGRTARRRGPCRHLNTRTQQRAAATQARLATAEHVVIGDLTSVSGMRKGAEEVNSPGRFDAVIHNADIGYLESQRVETVDGLSHVFAINVLAPYLLTALITPPARLVYLNSGMHRAGSPALDDLQWVKRRWDGAQSYADSKLFDVVLAFAIARRWADVLSNALEPGWVPTKTGGPGAPDDISLATLTQAWLAVSDDPAATVTVCKFNHEQARDVHPAVLSAELQTKLLGRCADLTGIVLPNP